MLNVYSRADQPPMTYEWTCSAGVFDQWDNSQYWVYWTAPQEPGTQNITCTVKDEQDDTEAFTFMIEVKERFIDDILEGEEVLSILKQKTAVIGGIWASTADGDIRYITSGTNEKTTWKGAFTSMDTGMSYLSSSYSLTLWGAGTAGTDIIVQTQGSSTKTLSCETCEDSDIINDLAIDVIDPDLLWVGSDSGLHYYTSSSKEWGDEPYQSGKTNDFFQGESFVYVATTNGIYEMNPYTEIATGDSCAVLEVVEDDDTVSVWHITGSDVCRDGQVMASQPGAVACSLDKDRNNTIWCGKYWWDDEDEEWKSPPGLEGIDITKSLASNEGLIYMLTSSGILLRW